MQKYAGCILNTFAVGFKGNRISSIHLKWLTNKAFHHLLYLKEAKKNA